MPVPRGEMKFPDVLVMVFNELYGRSSGVIL